MIKGTFADILISIYLLTTLYFRFTMLDSMANYPIVSIAFGGISLLFIWALVKVNFLQPNYFGLLKNDKLYTPDTLNLIE